MNRRSFLKSAVTGAGAAWFGPRMAFAQDYPSRVIRIVASNSAGTPPTSSRGSPPVP